MISFIRLNSLKASIDEVIYYLDSHNVDYERVKFFDLAFIIRDYDLRKSYLYEEGKIYFQSLSSMIPPLCFKFNPNDTVLDMCAAPGSKTSLMAMLDQSLLISAAEKGKVRSEKLKYNLDKLGARKVNVLNIDALKIDENMKFDKILIDAPCSGSGTFNKQNDMDLDKLCKLQASLIDKALKLIKDDGVIIYSTCSINDRENDLQIDRIIDKIELIDINDDRFKEINSNKSMYKECILIEPSMLFEGFYISCFKKKKNML